MLFISLEDVIARLINKFRTIFAGKSQHCTVSKNCIVPMDFGFRLRNDYGNHHTPCFEMI